MEDLFRFLDASRHNYFPSPLICEKNTWKWIYYYLDLTPDYHVI